MDPVVSALREQHAELSGLLDPLDGAGWERPSPCDGWSVSDVVLHLAQSDELAVASLAGRFADAVAAAAGGLRPAGSVDDLVDLMVARDRGKPGDAVRERWATSAGALRRALESADLHARVSWVSGELSARSLATTRLAEAWIHTGDVASALGLDVRPSAPLEHIARLAWRTLPYAFGRAQREMAGPIAFELRGPAGEAWDFVPEAPAVTVIRGDALELCLVAARRLDASDTGLRGDGPDAGAVLELVRTYA